MKGLKFGDNAATIGGKRVPYSLLGALAAILGAFLVWKQFQGGGGIALGQQSPDLAGLGDLSGGGAGGTGDIGNAFGGAAQGPPVYDLSYPAPVYGAGYGMDAGVAVMAPIPPMHVDYLLPPGPSSGGTDAGFTQGGYVPPAPTPSSAPASGGAGAGLTQGGYVAPPPPPPPPAPPPSPGGAGSFTP